MASKIGFRRGRLSLSGSRGIQERFVCADAGVGSGARRIEMVPKEKRAITVDFPSAAENRAFGYCTSCGAFVAENFKVCGLKFNQSWRSESLPRILRFFERNASPFSSTTTGYGMPARPIT